MSTLFMTDLKNNFDLSVWQQLDRLMNEVQLTDTHRNIKNYTDIQFKIEEYDCFCVVSDGNEVHAFSGLYNNGWYPSNCARALTRTYYSPTFRNPAMWSFSGKAQKSDYAERFFFPYQVEYAKQQGYDMIFFSMEYATRRGAMDALVKKLNKMHDQNWLVMADMYNCCRQHNDKGKFIGVNDHHSCWQNVALLRLTDITTGLELPSLSTRKWFQKYHHFQEDRLNNKLED